MLFTIEDYDLDETKVVVKFEFTPEERQIIYAAPEDCQEGSPAELEIYSVMDGTVDIVCSLTTDEYLEIADACHAEVEDYYGRLECARDDAADAQIEERRLGHE